MRNRGCAECGFRILGRAGDYPQQRLPWVRVHQKEWQGVSGTRLGGGDPHFAPGEAEEMVRDLRGYLRGEEDLRKRDELETAYRMRVRATSLVGELAQRLEKRFERYAWAAFREMPELIDDAVGQMFTELCSRAMDISGGNELMERRFNRVVQALCVDAIRRVRTQSDMTKDGRHRAGARPQSLDQAAGARGEDRPVQLIEPASPARDEPHNALMQKLLGQAAVAWYVDLPPRQQQIVQDRLLDGLPWAEVARRAGITPRAAQMDLDKAREALRAHMAKTVEGDE